MKLKSVSYGRTTSHNYQSKRVDVVVDLEPGDTFDDALGRAKTLVAIGLGETPSKEDVAKARLVLAVARAAKECK